MFCPNCGKEIPENTKYCNNCGLPVENNTASEAAPDNTQQPDAQQTNTSNYSSMETHYVPPVIPKKKSKAPIIIAIVIAAVVLVSVIFGIAYAVIEDIGDVLEESETHDQYEELFNDYGIDDIDSDFGDYKTASYVIDDYDGTVDKMEFAYKSDKVIIMKETIYIPLSLYSNEEIPELDTKMRDVYDELIEGYDFCSVDYDMDDDYYKITLTFNDLDNVENVQVMSKLGFIEESLMVRYISMSSTDEGLLEQGYFRK